MVRVLPVHYFDLVLIYCAFMDCTNHLYEYRQVRSFHILVAIRVDLESPLRSLTFLYSTENSTFFFFLFGKTSDNKTALKVGGNYFFKHSLGALLKNRHFLLRYFLHFPHKGFIQLLLAAFVGLFHHPVQLLLKTIEILYQNGKVVDRFLKGNGLGAGFLNYFSPVLFDVLV